MEQEFITTDGKIFINEEAITHKTLLTVKKDYWFHSFIALLFYSGCCMWSALNGNPGMWVFALGGIVWIWPHLERIFRVLFIKTWKRKIRLAEIKSILPKLELNSLETKVILKLTSAREKHFLFRNVENQAEPFIQSLLKNGFVK